MRSAAIVVMLVAACGPRPAGPAPGGARVEVDAGIDAAAIDGAADVDAGPIDAPVIAADDRPPCARACANLLACHPPRDQAAPGLCLASCVAERAAEVAALAELPCDRLDVALAAGNAPIVRRDCASAIATRAPAPSRAGRRDALTARLWCARGRGPLSALPYQFATDGVLWHDGNDACWVLDGDRLIWTRDGARWDGARVRWSRAGQPIAIGRQRLAPCPTPPPPIDPGDDHVNSSSNR